MDIRSSLFVKRLHALMHVVKIVYCSITQTEEFAALEERDEGAATQSEVSLTQGETPDQRPLEVIVIVTDTESEDDQEEEDEDDEVQVESLRFKRHFLSVSLNALVSSS